VDNLNRIQTKNLALTAAPKIASTNLVKFFVDRFDNIIESNGQKDDDGYMPNIIIVITRNERDRWCSGVIQELNELRLEHESKHSRVSYILDKEANSLGQKSIFTYSKSHGHLGTLGYFPYITELALRDNTYFTDISSLSKESFWERVCFMDNTWPNINEWWDDWNSFRNGIHGPPVSVNPVQIKRKELVSIVEDMLDNDTRLDFISTILDNNQKIITYLRRTDKWI
jgi:hypothetical protein